MNAKIIKTLTKRLEGSKILPYIKVNSVDDYFNLPSSERERWGLYRRPFALPCEWLETRMGKKSGDLKPEKRGWASWREQIKREYPVQWFLREWCFSYENPIYAFIKGVYFDYTEKKYAIKRFIKPFYPRFRKSMPRHKYIDVCEALKRVNFALILDFWHDEMSSGTVDWEDNAQHKNFYKRVEALVKYIEVERPALEKKADDALTLATNKKTGTYEQRYSKYNAIEAKIAQKDTDLLVWAMQNREMFWT
jgi:hypothetical protein